MVKSSSRHRRCLIQLLRLVLDIDDDLACVRRKVDLGSIRMVDIELRYGSTKLYVNAPIKHVRRHQHLSPCFSIFGYCILIFAPIL